jgi:hypothetical protein
MAHYAYPQPHQIPNRPEMGNKPLEVKAGIQLLNIYSKLLVLELGNYSQRFLLVFFDLR